MIGHMVKEHTCIMMVLNIQENGMKINNMAMGPKAGLIIHFMKDLIIWVKNMGLAVLFGI